MNEPRRDFELLREFVCRGDQPAFAALVRRHIDLVYATALRKLDEAGAAEEVAQNVFAILARKAWRFAPDDSLPGWLYRTTLLEAKLWLRGELRRRRRERIAAELGTTMNSADEQPALRALLPMLDEALLSLRERERTALLLRYYEARSLREVGASLGIGEDAAQKRVAGALENLSRYFQRRGFKTATVAAAAAALQHTATAAPAFVATTVMQAALPLGTVAVTGGKLWLARLAALTKIQRAAVLLAVVLAPALWHWHRASGTPPPSIAQVPPAPPPLATQPGPEPSMTLFPPAAPREPFPTGPVAETSTRPVQTPETEYNVQLRGIVDLPDFKGALVAVHHRSLDRPNAPPFVAKRVMRESEMFEDLSVRGAALRIELVRVSAQAGAATLRENGLELTCALEPPPPFSETPWTVVLPDPGLNDFVAFYAELINRTVLCYPSIKLEALSVTGREQDKTAAVRLFEKAMRERGISIVLEGERFALLLPTARVNELSAISRRTRVPLLKPDEELPRGSIYLENVELARAMAVYGDLCARKLTRLDAPAGRTLCFRGQTSLRRSEVLQAFDILLAWQGLKVVLIGDHEFRVTSLGGKQSS